MRCVIRDELARRFESRNRRIMRGAGAARCFDAYSVLARDDWLFPGAQMQSTRAKINNRDDVETVLGLVEIPLLDPNQPLAFAKTGFTERPSTRLLVEVKLLARNICDREVRKLQVIDDEARRIRSAFRDRLDPVPEERELVTETTACSIENVAGKIPPFSLEFAVGVMIPRKFVAPTRLRVLPFGGCVYRHDHGQKNLQSFHSSRRLSASAI